MIRGSSNARKKLGSISCNRFLVNNANFACLSAAEELTWRACTQRYTSSFRERFEPPSSSLSQPLCRMWSLSKPQNTQQHIPSPLHQLQAPISREILLRFPKFFFPRIRTAVRNRERVSPRRPKWSKSTLKGCPKQPNMTPHFQWAKTPHVTLARRVLRYETLLHERTPALQRLMPLTASCHCPKCTPHATNRP